MADKSATPPREGNCRSSESDAYDPLLGGVPNLPAMLRPPTTLRVAMRAGIGDAGGRAGWVRFVSVSRQIPKILSYTLPGSGDKLRLVSKHFFLQDALNNVTDRIQDTIEMPIISRFFGIVIYMLWREHKPPHFHAKYGDDEVTVEIENGNINGNMSKRALSLVQEWRKLHQEDLRREWELVEQKKPLFPIRPLE